jgi:hypothetical protein
MPHINDLELCSALPVQGSALVAIGWLSQDHAYPQGKVSDEFFVRLQVLCHDPWEPFTAGGSHQCGLCQYDGPRFGTNLFVPAGDRIFVAPSAITHYIAAHWYLPPTPFVQAVLRCPPTRSMDYKKAILASGGRQLLASAA